VFFWVVPANFAGGWRWQIPLGDRTVECRLAVEQNFQAIKGEVAIGDKRFPLEKAEVKGEEIRLTVADDAGTRYDFSGRMNGKSLNGTATVAGANGQSRVKWAAQRTEIGTPAHELLPPPVLQELQVPEIEPGR
jgi:hypothetical protein